MYIRQIQNTYTSASGKTGSCQFFSTWSIFPKNFESPSISSIWFTTSRGKNSSQQWTWRAKRLSQRGKHLNRSSRKIEMGLIVAEETGRTHSPLQLQDLHHLLNPDSPRRLGSLLQIRRRPTRYPARHRMETGGLTRLLAPVTLAANRCITLHQPKFTLFYTNREKMSSKSSFSTTSKE